MEKRIEISNVILIDAHVHIHDCFIINDFLNSAWNNFKNAAEEFFVLKKFSGILFLTESYGVNKFNILKEKAKAADFQKDLNDSWSFYATREENSLIASKNAEQKLVIIAGRQIVTSENLEVLGLGILDGIEDKETFEQAVKKITSRGGCAVIPWGVGKWIGNKRKLIEKIPRMNDLKLIFIGDNGNRPFFWSNKKIFKKYGAKDIRNLSGSDPLPFKSENGRAGSFGFAVEGFLNFEQPFKSILEIISDKQAELIQYGRLETPFRFFRNQILMQIKKKLR